ncbi:MAG: M56 family metallopeptidase [Lachnospiraceae bacterium]|nr:M56 family metallopeptidase [Lachnospiraceae bacterium]
MKDFWSFLLQTLTVSSAAVLVLAAKALFKDKISPRWQFCSWGLVALALLLPAGFSGGYALINWPLLVETAKSILTGEYGTLTKVVAPVPLPVFQSGKNVFDWVYIIYVAGVVCFLIRYAILYLRLRLALRRVKKESAWRGFICEKTEDNEQIGQSGIVKYQQDKNSLVMGNGEQTLRRAQEFVDAVAEKYGLSSCMVLEVEGLASAFICGVFRPVLVLPKGVGTDEKIILHELLHLKYHDVLWGLIICFFRCLHWCNPLIWICAELAGNDLESLCDQRVLERLSGEQRRDYGRILLDMAGGKYAKMPGTSSIANGGKNIRRRIMAIALFKKYPSGMGLVFTCILILFSLPFLVGTKPETALGEESLLLDQDVSVMARARLIRCTTCAGAFDTYAKAVLTGNIPYLAMCAPLGEQNLLAEAYQKDLELGSLEKMALPAPADLLGGYMIYNLTEKEENVWEGFLVLKLSDSLCGKDMREKNEAWFAMQYVRAEKQQDRFVVIPKEEFTSFQADEWILRCPNGEEALPAWCYEDEAEDFVLRLRWQTAASVESQGLDKNGNWLIFDPTPQPDGVFSFYSGYRLSATYTGDPKEKDRYTQVGHVGHVVWDRTKETEDSLRTIVPEGVFGLGKEEPDRSGRELGHGTFSSAGTDGNSWGSSPLKTGWEDEIVFGKGGGGSISLQLPDCYMVELYLNNRLHAKFTLELLEGSWDYGR